MVPWRAGFQAPLPGAFEEVEFMDPVGSANTAPPSPGATSPWPREPRTLSASRGVDWWAEGWRVFMAAPLVWIGVTVVFALIMIALGNIPILGQLAAAVLWPLFMGGLFLGCRELANGRPLAFGQLFAGFQAGRATALVILGVIAAAVGLAMVVVVSLFMFGAVGFSGMAGMMSGDPSVAMGRAMAGVGVAALIAMPFVIVAGVLFTMAWWLATPLVVLCGAQPVDALKASFEASWKNLGALVIAGLVGIALSIVASIPFGLGWLVLMPVSVGANFAAWREIFGD